MEWSINVGFTSTPGRLSSSSPIRLIERHPPRRMGMTPKNELNWGKKKRMLEKPLTAHNFAIHAVFWNEPPCEAQKKVIIISIYSPNQPSAGGISSSIRWMRFFGAWIHQFHKSVPISLTFQLYKEMKMKITTRTFHQTHGN